LLLSSGLRSFGSHCYFLRCLTNQTTTNRKIERKIGTNSTVYKTANQISAWQTSVSFGIGSQHLERLGRAEKCDCPNIERYS
jgi:hypothetical protein